MFKGLLRTTNGCVLGLPNFNLSYTVNATHNYWGTSDFKLIVESVCGFESDFEKALVWYLLFYTDEALLTLSANTQQDFNISGVFGGNIADDLIINKSTFLTDLRISRSIIIRYSNIQLYFSSRYST